MPRDPGASIAYMPQLDSVRALAVAAVLVHHFLPVTRRFVDFGYIGVQTFFVLSGFLITSILLRAREARDAPRELRRFYARRAIRIFPLFYLVLAIVTIVGALGAREDWPWHAAYLSNVLFFVREDWFGPNPHFWSLAVEEQFYLAWPFLLLLLPRRALVPTVLAAIVSAPVFRVAAWSVTGTPMLAILPFANLDTLGIGALLALAADRSIEMPARLREFWRAGFWIGIPLLLFGRLLEVRGRWDHAQWVVIQLGVGLAAAALVGGAARGFGGPLGWLLDDPRVRYVGTISYGIYIIHLPLALAMPSVAEWLGAAGAFDRTPMIVGALLFSALTIALASLSWHFFERPINSLKRHIGRRAADVSPGASPGTVGL